MKAFARLQQSFVCCNTIERNTFRKKKEKAKKQNGNGNGRGCERVKEVSE